MTFEVHIFLIQIFNSIKYIKHVNKNFKMVEIYNLYNNIAYLIPISHIELNEICIILICFKINNKISIVTEKL